MIGTRAARPRACRLISTAAAALVLSVPAASRAAGEGGSCDRPAIAPLRYDEDYSFLRDPRCPTDFWDPLKYLALNRGVPV
jgi:hypothetical protein